jgi:transposase
VPEKKKRTYKQSWHEYNLAQTNEKTKFLELLYELTRNVEDLPRKQGAGRNRLPVRDMIFCAAFKTYSLFSGRRFGSDIKDANQRGLITRAPHFNSIFNYLELEEMTVWLKQLIVTSSLPLKSVEWDFAVDSTGISTGLYQKWVDAKWCNVRTLFGDKVPNEVNRKDWIKVHLICGIKTNIVTAVEITDAHAGDSPRFGPLVETTSQNFPIQSVAADKAYSAENNQKLVLRKGGQPYIAFRSNATTENKRSGDVWKKMLHFYQYNQDWFMEHYHKRSNVETTFWMIKSKFGDRVRCKTETAKVNEALCKVLCHNICCLIQSIYELGIEVDFGAEK